MINEPTVTIIIPVWNDERVLKDTLKSLKEVDYPLEKCELIIIAGGEDNTRSTAKNFEKGEFGEYVVIEQTPNDSKSGALIKGLKRAKKDIVVLLDADTRVSKQWLRELLSTMKNENYDAVNGTYYPKSKDNIISHFMIAEMTYQNQKGISRLNAFASIAIKRSIIDKHGIDYFFKKDLIGNDDFYLLRQLTREGYRVGIAKNAVVLTCFPTTIKKFIEDNVRWRLAWYDIAKKNRFFLFENFFRSFGIIISSLTIIYSLLLFRISLILIPFYAIFGLFVLKVVLRLVPVLKEDKRYVIYFPSILFLNLLTHINRVLAVFLKLFGLKQIKNYKGAR